MGKTLGGDSSYDPLYYIPMVHKLYYMPMVQPVDKQSDFVWTMTQVVLDYMVEITYQNFTDSTQNNVKCSFIVIKKRKERMRIT